MRSTAVLDHFRRPHSAGVLPDADAIGRAENPVCGDVLELSLRFAGGVIAEARFRAQSCVEAVACASHLTDLVQGLAPEQARALTAAALTESLGGLPEGSAHAAQLAIAALRAALRSR
jgi:nitrogen fixation NifU-like protein